MSPGCVDCHPSHQWVSSLEVGLSSDTTAPRRKCSAASSAAMLALVDHPSRAGLARGQTPKSAQLLSSPWHGMSVAAITVLAA